MIEQSNVSVECVARTDGTKAYICLPGWTYEGSCPNCGSTNYEVKPEIDGDIISERQICLDCPGFSRPFFY